MKPSYEELEQKLIESERYGRQTDITIDNLEMQLKIEREAKLALAAENAGLKGAFDKPQAYLSWHAIPPTWEDPLPCGEYLDVHDEAGHKNSDGTDCWPVYAKPEIETPATDAFLAEVRAQGVELFAESQKECVRKNRNELDSMTRAAYCGSAVDAEKFAAELRKGGNQ
ncbi:hypothetical protein [Escherichia coli]|uniref:hypothetical protein n=1 Tax=Escherichia coli TaxID=562 RepID=UPI00351D11C8